MSADKHDDCNGAHVQHKDIDYTLNIKPHILISKNQDLLIRHRRHLHTIPELAFEEHETAKYIVKELKAYGVDKVVEGVGKTGVVGLIHGKSTTGKQDYCVAIRADMDALPVQEIKHNDTQATFMSKNGKMHCCGHDGHMAILLTAAKALCDSRDQFSGTVKLIFQPAEEGLGGAKEMIKDGVMGGNKELGPKVNEVYGLHLWTYTPTGTVDVKVGTMMASSDRIDLTVNGKGGHGAVPEGTADAIVAACYLVTQLQTIVSRNVSPLDSAVLSIGQIRGGFNYNIISDKVEVIGTVRTFKPETKDMIEQRIRDICKGIELSHHVNIDVVYFRGYPATINYTDVGVDTIKAAAHPVVSDNGIKTPLGTMAAEDFSYFMNECNHGAFFFCGANPSNKTDDMNSYPHHKSNFDINEDSLLVGASVWVNLVHKVLGEK